MAVISESDDEFQLKMKVPACRVQENWRDEETDFIIFLTGDGQNRVVDRNDLHVEYPNFMLQLAPGK